MIPEDQKNMTTQCKQIYSFHTEKIQVKIITTAYDSDDDTLHVLSDKDSEAFRNMIVDMIVCTCVDFKTLNIREFIEYVL